MRKLLLFFVFTAAAFAQNPDCQISFGPWTDLQTTPSNSNAVTQCTYWVYTYQVTGFSAISLRFESATGTVSSGAGAFGAYSGTVSSGINPSTSVVCSTVTNCTATFTGQIGWYRMALNSKTGSGTLQGVLKGYKVGYPLGGAAAPGGGCVGTAATPCVVVGPVASGAVMSGDAPVKIAGTDGIGVKTVSVDSSGDVKVVGPATEGVEVSTFASVMIGGNDSIGSARSFGAPPVGTAPSGSPFLQGKLGSGATGGFVARAINCDSSAVITFTAASGSVQIVALTASQIVYVCSIVLSSDTVTNITLNYGTGSACGTGTTALSGAFNSVLALSMSFPDGSLRTAASNAFCVNSSVAATIGGVMTYAKF